VRILSVSVRVPAFSMACLSQPTMSYVYSAIEVFGSGFGE
jgi:hypothetical protein